jgi:hypothetical protein
MRAGTTLPTLNFEKSPPALSGSMPSDRAIASHKERRVIAKIMGCP